MPLEVGSRLEYRVGSSGFRAILPHPRQLHDLLNELKDGEIEVRFRHAGLDELISKVDILANRLVVGLLLAALILGSSMLGIFVESGAGFVVPPHLVEDFGKKQILPRLIRLTRHGALLSAKCFLRAVLLHQDLRNQVERSGLMNVEPAGVTQSRSSAFDISFLSEQAAVSSPGRIMPPIFLSEVADHR